MTLQYRTALGGATQPFEGCMAEFLVAVTLLRPTSTLKKIVLETRNKKDVVVGRRLASQIREKWTGLE